MNSTAKLLTLALLGLGITTSRADLTIGEAVNNTNLIWNTGGSSAPWFPETTITHDGLHAAQSGGTNDNDWSYLQTTITGKVAVTFWWKQSTATNYTGAGVYVYGDAGSYTAAQLTGEQDWQQVAICLGGGTNYVEWYYDGPGPDRPIRNGNAAWLDQVTLTNIDGLAPVILAQPPATLVALDNYPSILHPGVAAIGDMPLTFQWLHSDTNLSEGWPFYNTATPMLTIYQPSATEAGDYTLVLSNQWGMVTSAVCTVSIVPSLPYIDPTLPADVAVAPGNWVFVQVYSIYGTMPFSYQWLSNNVPIPLATYNWLWCPSVNAGYSVVVSNSVGVVTSRVAQVTVSMDPPTILDGPNPTQQVVDPGNWVDFWVDVTGPQPLNFNWYQIGNSNSLAYGNYLQFTADPTNTGLYYAIVSNPNGSVTSSVCVLAVTPADPIGVAIDQPSLAIDNSTWPYWSVDVASTNAYDGLCSARSGSIGAYQSVPFSATIQGPTNLTFWWRIDADTQAYLDLSVDDGASVAEISGQTAWQQQSLTLTDGVHTVTWTFSKDNAGTVGQDAAWVDQLVLSGTPTNITGFTTGGDASWYLETTNVHTLPDAWQSGAIPPPGTGESTWLSTTVTGPGTISFWWQLSNYSFCGLLDFSMDGGPSLAETNGFVPWTYQSFPVGSGAHTLTWTYSQSCYGPGANAAWVDDVLFTTSAPPAGVSFPDPNLEAAVRSALGIPSNPIMPADMLLLTELDANWANIADLTGLEYATNLQSLYLESNYTLTNVTAFASLVNLTSLDLDYCNFTNLAALAGLENLNSLILYENGLTSLAGFPALTNLTDLEISYNQITNLAPLTNLVNLRYLYANDNQINDLHPLAVLPRLSELIVSDNQIGDTNGLSLLHNLTYLDADNNQISDISFVENMPDLQYLMLDYNPITNTLPLNNNPSINLLDLGYTQVRDVSFAARMPNLLYLNLSGDPITNHAALSGAPRLLQLSIDQTGLRDLAALTGLTNLTFLTVNYNPLTNYCPVNALRQLNYLYMRYDGLTDISCLSGLANLTYLDLVGNALTNVPALSGLGNLHFLNLSYNQIQSASGLAGLTSLTELYIGFNPLTSLPDLSGLGNLQTLYVSYDQLQNLNGLAGLAQLQYLYASSNNLQNISGLLTCSNLNYAILDQNYLNTSPGSPAMSVISALQSRGVIVYYPSQRALPIFFSAPQWPGAAQFGFTVNSAPDAAFDLLVSSNLVRWDVLEAITNVTGSDTFTVPGTNQPASFYRLRAH